MLLFISGIAWFAEKGGRLMDHIPQQGIGPLGQFDFDNEGADEQPRSEVRPHRGGLSLISFIHLSLIILVFYALSIGPITAMVASSRYAYAATDELQIIYTPILWACHKSFRVKNFLNRYLEFYGTSIYYYRGFHWECILYSQSVEPTAQTKKADTKMSA